MGINMFCANALPQCHGINRESYGHGARTVGEFFHGLECIDFCLNFYWWLLFVIRRNLDPWFWVLRFRGKAGCFSSSHPSFFGVRKSWCAGQAAPAYLACRILLSSILYLSFSLKAQLPPKTQGQSSPSMKHPTPPFFPHPESFLIEFVKEWSVVIVKSRKAGKILKSVVWYWFMHWHMKYSPHRHQSPSGSCSCPKMLEWLEFSSYRFCRVCQCHQRWVWTS